MTIDDALLHISYYQDVDLSTTVICRLHDPVSENTVYSSHAYTEREDAYADARKRLTIMNAWTKEAGKPPW